ncbi:MAG: hypothetical protein ABWK05_07185 [Pyrobaculum sp.]
MENERIRHAVTVLADAVKKCGHVYVRVLDKYVVVEFVKINDVAVDYWAATMSTTPKQYKELIKRRIETARFRVRHPGVKFDTPWGPIMAKWKAKSVKVTFGRRSLYVALYVAVPRKLAEEFTKAFHNAIDPEDRTAFMDTPEWKILRAYIKGALKEANYTCN